VDPDPDRVGAALFCRIRMGNGHAGHADPDRYKRQAYEKLINYTFSTIFLNYVQNTLNYNIFESDEKDKT
jgi:hypothetical protein